MNKSLTITLLFSVFSSVFAADNAPFLKRGDEEFLNQFLRISNRRRAIEEEMAQKRMPNKAKMYQLKKFGKNSDLRALVNNK